MNRQVRIKLSRENFDFLGGEIEIVRRRILAVLEVWHFSARQVIKQREVIDPVEIRIYLPNEIIKSLGFRKSRTIEGILKIIKTKGFRL